MRDIKEIILGAKCCNATGYTCNKCPYNRQMNCFQDLEEDLNELYEKLVKGEQNGTSYSI